MSLPCRHGPAEFFRLGTADSELADLSIVDNTFVNAYWYAVQLFKSERGITLPRVTVRDNEIRNFHGAVYLNGVDGGEIVRNTLFRNSFGNIVLTGRNLLVAENRVIFPGNGTSGDGITFGGSESVVLENNIVSNGTCYGIWFVTSVSQVTVTGNVFHAGITSAINFEPARVNVLGLGTETGSAIFNFEDIAVEGNLFSHNAAASIRAVEVKGLTLVQNMLQGNALGDTQQHQFFGVVDVIDRENRASDDRNRTEPAASAKSTPYSVQSPHIILHDEELFVYGSPAGENFIIEPNYRGLLRVQWGLHHASFDRKAVAAIQVVGEGGADFARMFANPGSDTYELRAFDASVKREAFSIRVVGVASLDVRADEADLVNLFDSPADESFSVQATGSRLRGGGSNLAISGANDTRIVFSQGGEDSMVVESGDADDQVRAAVGLNEQTIHLGARAFRIQAGLLDSVLIDTGQGFDQVFVTVRAFSKSGADTASLFETAGSSPDRGSTFTCRRTRI